MKTGKIEQDSKVDPESNLLVRCAETPASNHRPRTPEQKTQLNKIPAFLIRFSWLLIDPCNPCLSVAKNL